VKQWLGLLARLVVAGFLITAGYLKFSDPAGNVRAVRAYRLLPEAVVPTVGHALPTIELILGFLLLLGLFTRYVAGIAGLFFLAFIIGISSAWARGLEINCGCFGSGGVPANARDLGLLALCVWLAVWPRTRLALDNLLFPSHERLADGEQDQSTVEV
jgi:uncharacterized membrane protein YphA (DoxX/SURF4 family)